MNLIISHIASCAKSTWNWFTLSFINSTTHIHACFYIVLLILWHVTSTNEMALIDLDNHIYGHWCIPLLHLGWYYVTNDSDVHFYFCSSVEASSPLKVLNFLWTLFRFIELIGTYEACGVFLEWQLNWNEEKYNMGNKLLKCEWILSYHLLVQETFQGIMWTPCAINLTIYCRNKNSKMQNISFERQVANTFAVLLSDCESEK